MGKVKFKRKASVSNNYNVCLVVCNRILVLRYTIKHIVENAWQELNPIKLFVTSLITLWL